MAVQSSSLVEPLHVRFTHSQAGRLPTCRTFLLRDIHPSSSAVLPCRQMLETSTAVQCPTVAYQLAGTKKVQQDLAAAGTLEHFLPQQADRDLVDACCAGLLCQHRACLCMLAIRWGSCGRALPCQQLACVLGWAGACVCTSSLSASLLQHIVAADCRCNVLE